MTLAQQLLCLELLFTFLVVWAAADNAVSNARWCCNDMPHLDLSSWALEKLVTDMGKGVFGISYRTISCGAEIANVRSLPCSRLASLFSWSLPRHDSCRNVLLLRCCAVLCMQHDC